MEILILIQEKYPCGLHKKTLAIRAVYIASASLQKNTNSAVAWAVGVSVLDETRDNRKAVIRGTRNASKYAVLFQFIDSLSQKLYTAILYSIN